MSLRILSFRGDLGHGMERGESERGTSAADKSRDGRKTRTLSLARSLGHLLWSLGHSFVPPALRAISGSTYGGSSSTHDGRDKGVRDDGGASKKGLGLEKGLQVQMRAARLSLF